MEVRCVKKHGHAKKRSSVLIIDPSVRALGWAELRATGVLRCGVLQPVGLLDVPRALWPIFANSSSMDCIIERPRIYPHSPVPPNDIATLSISVGIALALAHERGMSVKLVYPTQLDKQKTERRVRKRVDNLDELLQGISKSLRHNAIDAIALGLREGKP